MRYYTTPHLELKAGLKPATDALQVRRSIVGATSANEDSQGHKGFTQPCRFERALP